jgi:hypothetical protein
MSNPSHKYQPPRPRLGLWFLLLLIAAAVAALLLFPREDESPRDFVQRVFGELRESVAAPESLTGRPDQAPPVPSSPVLPAPALTEEALAAMKENVAPLMELSPAQVADLVPVQAGFHFCESPAAADAAGGKNRDVLGDFKWSPRDPKRITCRETGEVFPGNPRYPETGVLEVASLGDTVHRYPYHEDSVDGRRIFFAAKADFMAREYLARSSLELARLWQATGVAAYAERGAAILVRFAEVYPGYALKYESTFDEKILRPPGSGFIESPLEHPNWKMQTQRTAKWSWWGPLDLSWELVQSYDILRTWSGFAGLAGGRADALVREDLLGAKLDWVSSYNDYYDNMSPTMWISMVKAARVLGRPEAVREVIARAGKLLEGRTHYDGSWLEPAPSYMTQTAGNMKILRDAFEGYEDPSVDPSELERLWAASERLREAEEVTRFPDGQRLPVNDTWAGAGHRKLAPRTAMEPVLFPGFGVALLGGGAGSDQIHAYLNASNGRAHVQKSALSIGLWFGGREWLSDIGYTHTSLRGWATSTASHNTVTVDGQDQQLGQGSGWRSDYRNAVRWFVGDAPGFQTVQAEAPTVYAQTSRYVRTLALIGQDAGDAVLVDIFVVAGGRQHDFIVAGNADEDTELQVGLDLQAYAGSLLPPGFRFVPATNENNYQADSGLGYIRNLRSAPAPGTVRFTTTLKGDATQGLHSWLDGGPGTTLFAGEAPSVRRAGEAETRSSAFLMPVLVARRTAGESTFVAVHDPVRPGRPPLDAVDIERLDGAVLVVLRRGSRTEAAVFSTGRGEAAVETALDGQPLVFRGRQGLVRLENGRVDSMVLAGGELLRFGENEVADAPLLTGQVLGLGRGETENSRGWFDLAGTIPPDTRLGALVTVWPDGRRQAYNIVRLEASGANTRAYVKESPSYDVVGGQIVPRYFLGQAGEHNTIAPQNKVSGTEVTYELPTITTR